MDILLNDRCVQLLDKIVVGTTFKILESSFVYMKIDVEGLAIQPIPSSEVKDAKRKMVEIPEGKIPIVCLDTGKAQWLDLKEKVAVVVLKAKEILEVKGE